MNANLVDHTQSGALFSVLVVPKWLYSSFVPLIVLTTFTNWCVFIISINVIFWLSSYVPCTSADTLGSWLHITSNTGRLRSAAIRIYLGNRTYIFKAVGLTKPQTTPEAFPAYGSTHTSVAFQGWLLLSFLASLNMSRFREPEQKPQEPPTLQLGVPCSVLLGSPIKWLATR